MVVATATAAVFILGIIGAVDSAARAHPHRVQGGDDGPCPFAAVDQPAVGGTRGHRQAADAKPRRALQDNIFAATGESSQDTLLTQSHFASGTYRITQPGTYKLDEDINFCPNPDDDYWPTIAQWDEYPPAAFYLGFFAAITIESDDVVIDLNGKTIQQCEQHYLLQRFFNVIELNNRVFIQNEGVSSLNYQETDVPAASINADQAGAVITPSNVEIRNGRIGRSSHAGIHGNSVTGLTVRDVAVTDFEVAGLHCNGCKDVLIEDVNVGPSARDVPVLATFANARFLELYTQTLIPEGFAGERVDGLDELFEDTITFADRPGSPVTIREVFDRLKKAIELYRDYLKDDDTDDLSDNDLALLEEAKAVFTNPVATTDGSVQYGIFFNRRGLPTQDDNFVGAGVESSNIVIRNVNILGLHASPVEVPSLMTEEGSHMQGPSRDIIRIFDITTDKMRTLLDSKYLGNFLADTYFALWKLSNSFYRVRVFDSECGNFGSNATMPYNLKTFPSYDELTCAQLGESADPSLLGREIALIQRQYFGGLQVSQGFFDWATTPGLGLDAILASPQSADDLRAGARHKIVCDHDTMFHPAHGVVGIKIVESKNVNIESVSIADLLNAADEQIWVCGAHWQLQPSGEDVRPTSAAPNSSGNAMVRGVEVVRSEEMVLSSVTIEGLKSDEGAVVGIEIKGDGNDRTDHMDDAGILFEGVLVNDLSGPLGANGVKSDATTLMTPAGINVGQPEETDASLNNPRVVINYGLTNSRSPRDPAVDVAPLVVVDDTVIPTIMSVTSMNTVEKIKEWRKKALAHYKQHFGMVFDETYVYENDDLLEAIKVYDKDGIETDSVIQLASVDPGNLLHVKSVCRTDGDGSNGECLDVPAAVGYNHAFIFLPGPSGYVLHGAFGGDAGKVVPPLNVILVGQYTFEGLTIPAINDGENVEIQFFGECPTSFTRFTGESVSWYIQCALESSLFGKGVASGAAMFIPTQNGKEWILNAGLSMVFDEFERFPQQSIAISSDLAPLVRDIELNDRQFSIIADGKFSTLLSGIEAVPYGEFYHYTHEAGLQYLKTRTSLKTDDDILALRSSFLNRLVDYFEIDFDPSDYDDIPLDGEIDFGGAGKITAYVVNEDANQRVMTSNGPNGAVAMPPASRLHEGGFRYVVGRAGMNTKWGRLPFGSMILEGRYVMEDAENRDREMQFYSLGAIQMNGWATSVVYNYVYDKDYGEGRLSAMVPLPIVDKDGIAVKVRGSMVFGNLGDTRYWGN